MDMRSRVELRASFAFIYLFAGACTLFTIFRLVQALFQGPEFAYSFLFDIWNTGNGIGFARRLFWTGLSGLPLLFVALAAPSLDKKRFSVVFAICLALPRLPALFYAYMDMESVEYYAAHGVDMSTHLKTLPLNYWPTSLSLLCYAHIGIDGIARSVLSRKDGSEGSR